MTDNKELFAALARAIGKIKTVEKSGENAFHKYRYATEADIARVVSPILSAEGLCWLPSVSEVRTEELPGSKRGERLTTVTLEVLWCHSSGGTHLTRWQGQGVDQSDKGYYKAYTGALKYALLKTLLIATGDDPEEDDAPPPPRQPHRSEPTQAEADAAWAEAWATTGLDREVELAFVAWARQQVGAQELSPSQRVKLAARVRELGAPYVLEKTT